MSEVEIKQKKVQKAKKKVEDPEEFEKSLEENSVDKNKIKQMLAEKRRENEMVEMVKKSETALNWFVVGCGQGGSRIAESFHDNGYEAIAINTAEQDLKFINLPEGNKCLIKYALDGAAKDLSVGEEAFSSFRDEIDKFVQGKVPTDTNMIILAVTGGGGTGSGGAYPMIDMLKEYGYPLAVLYVLPLESDDVTSKNNSLVTLSRLAKLARSNVINSLMIVDNAKIETLPYLKQGNFWAEANKLIVEPLHMFNALSVCPSNYTSLDPMDTGKLLTTGDCCIYGHIEVKDYMDQLSIAEAIIDTLESGLLASGFDLKTARSAGVIILGDKDVLDNIPAININYAFDTVNEITENATVYRGTYEAKTNGKILIYTMFSGLGLPKERIEKMKEDTQKRMKIQEQKSKDRGVTMEMDYGEDEVSGSVKRVHEQIKNKRSAFNKLANTAKGGVIDRRKR